MELADVEPDLRVSQHTSASIPLQTLPEVKDVTTTEHSIQLQSERNSMTRPTSPEQVFRTEVFITFKTPPRSPSSKSLPQNSTSSKATAVTQTESDDLDLFPSDESSDESLASIQSHNRYFEDSYIGDAHPEDLYPEQQLTSDLDSGVSEVTNAIELPGSSPLNDTTEQDLLDVYNTFSPSAASEPLPATESFQDKLPSMLDKSPSCPSLLTILPSNDGQSQGVLSNDDSLNSSV